MLPPNFVPVLASETPADKFAAKMSCGMTGEHDGRADQAALAMLQRSDSVPPPPPLIADEALTFTMPVIFHVKGQN
jgi:hypothetical protein